MIKQLSSTNHQVYMKTHYMLTSILTMSATSIALKFMPINLRVENARYSLGVQIFATNTNSYVMTQQD